MQAISVMAPLKLGYTPDDGSNIPVQLDAILERVIETYRRYHSDLLSIYVVGSVVNGEWLPEISDLDAIGITETPPPPDIEERRRQELVAYGEQVPQVSFIDNSVLSLSELRTVGDIHLTGKARIIAVSSLLIWGEAIDFSAYFPTIADTARQRAIRAEALMRKYRAGNLIEPFRRNEQLLTRSCAKAAMRVLSSIAIMRGALFYTSPFRTFKTVEECVPEALEIAQSAIAIIRGDQSTPAYAMSLTDRALELYRELCPED